jgi:hypothetical protein
MAVHRRIADLIPKHDEGQFLTLTGNSAAYLWVPPVSFFADGTTDAQNN